MKNFRLSFFSILFIFICSSIHAQENTSLDNAVFDFGNGLSPGVTGINNSAFGYKALNKLTSGSHNSALGHSAMFNTLVGWFNTSIGDSSLVSNTSGSYNVAVGNIALQNSTSGRKNVAVGHSSGVNILTGTQNVIIGDLAGPTGDFSNTISIGSDAAATANNTVRIGNGAITDISGVVNFTASSDKYLKKNIENSELGLNFILNLRPVQYNMRDKAHDGILYTGFVAQEVEATLEGLGAEFSGLRKPNSETDFYGLRYADFTVPLVKAVQELSETVNEQKSIINQQEEELQAYRQLMHNMESRLAALENKGKESSTVSSLEVNNGGVKVSKSTDK